MQKLITTAAAIIALAASPAFAQHTAAPADMDRETIFEFAPSNDIAAAATAQQDLLASVLSIQIENRMEAVLHDFNEQDQPAVSTANLQF